MSRTGHDVEVVRLGVIGDTHGLLRPEVFEVLAGVDHILHAGDVGDPNILLDLAAIAPVQAVWGNMDGPEIRARTSEVFQGKFGAVRVAMTHGHLARAFEVLPARFPEARLIIHGHTHVPRSDAVGEAILLNPGSAGPRRPGKPVALAVVTIRNGRIQVRHVDLESGVEFRPLGAG
ncbi:MAG: metallophosphoesterase family protein [Gemmatimonadota bacterium]